MKKIEAVIKPFKLEEVRDALKKKGVLGMIVTEVKGVGRLRENIAEYDIDFLPKVKIEIIASEDKVDDIVDAIIVSAKTGRVGDGKIFVSDITKVIRIRTGEEDGKAVD